MNNTTLTNAEKATLEFIEKNEITFDNVTDTKKLNLMLQHVIRCGTTSGILSSSGGGHRIYNYNFKVNNRFRNVLGRCNYNKRLIELSGAYLKNGKLVHVVQTLMHEFCHHVVYHTLGKGYRDGDTTFESLIKACNSKSTRTTEVSFSMHTYKADCGCVFTRHSKRNYDGYVCGEHKDSKIRYVGFLTADEIKELKLKSKN